MADKKLNWQRIKFICIGCGKESWTEFDLNTYVMKVEDLVCDDCIPEDENEEIVVKAEVM